MQEGSGKCWNCGTQLAPASKKGAPTGELRARQRTGSRVFGVVFKIGDLIANRYRVSDIIGSGGAGVVYRAHDQEIDVDVAVKVINAKLVQTADEQRLFSRQTKIARKLSHQNVVRIYDEGRDEDRPFYTMQFLEGLSLRKIIDLRREKQQTFVLAEIEPIYNQLCQALDYAHKTTFHGNLKPDNVIVLPDLLKVTDFALLRGLPRKPFLAIQKSRASNFRYLAPEVRLEVNELDRQIDIYSLGVILAEMLTGLLYDDAKPEQLSAAPGIDAPTLSVMKRATSRVSKDRYLAAGELYEDLRAILAKGAGGRPASRVSAASDAPILFAEMPTQRVDMSKQGDRAPSMPMPVVEDRPSAVEVSPAFAVPDAPASQSQGDRDLSGTFAQIDDDMIESASPSGPQEPAAASASKQSEREEEEDFDDTDSETEALLEGPPQAPPRDPSGDPTRDATRDSSREATRDSSREATRDSSHDLSHDPPKVETGLSGLFEISNSAIELIADPSATNLIRVESGLDASHLAVEPQIVSRDELFAPIPPLADSAIPSPAFSDAVGAREATALGRLDVPVEAPVTPAAPIAPEVVLRGAPDTGTRAIDAQHLLPRSPTLPMEMMVPENARAPTNGHGHPNVHAGTNGRPTKSRPMTRPRLSAVPAIHEPVLVNDPLFELPPPDLVRSPTGARPLTVDRGTVKSLPPGPIPTASLPSMQTLAMPVSMNRGVLVTLGFSAIAVVAAFLIIFKIQSDQQARQAATQQAQIAALQQQLVGLQKDAKPTPESAPVARVDAAEKKAAAELEAKTREDEAAKRRAAEAQAQVLSEAKKKAEAQALSDAQALAEAKKKAEAEKAALAVRLRSDEQRRAADEQRRAADEEAKREREARAKEEAERKKKERDELAAKAAEERAAKAAEEQAAEAAKKDAAKKEAAKKEELAAAETASSVSLAATIPGVKGCPKGMAIVDGGAFMMGAARNDPERNFGDLNYASTEVSSFCVDYYEFPNGRDRAPSGGVTFKAAQQQCKAKGKRLCTEAEWEKACKGPSGTRFPYGNQWDPSACATEDDEGNDRTIGKSGEFKRCRSGFNVFDLSGNLAEWTASEYGAGAYVVKGGAADRPGYDARCAARKKKKAADSDALLGFRCCADPTN